MPQLALQSSPGLSDSAQLAHPYSSPQQPHSPHHPQHQQRHQQQRQPPSSQRQPSQNQQPRLPDISLSTTAHQLSQQQQQQPGSPASPTSPALSTSSSGYPLAAQSSPSYPPSPTTSFSRPTYDSTSAARTPQTQHRGVAGGTVAVAQSSTYNTIPLSPRSPRRTAPSPLQTSVVPLPQGISPISFNFSFPATRLPASPHTKNASVDSVDTPQIGTTTQHPLAHAQSQQSSGPEKTYFNSDSSSEASSPVEYSQSPGPRFSSRYSNDNRSVSDSVVNLRPLAGSSTTSRADMAGPSTAPRADAVSGTKRNPSVDSGVSALSNGSAQRKDSTDSTSLSDIPSIIKAAGSPEAVIEHLLKEKQAQSQQNSQLWRLVDKQRAMILGLNKDLERALKEKEKYRKKLREVLPEQEERQLAAVTSTTSTVQQGPQLDVGGRNIILAATGAAAITGSAHDRAVTGVVAPSSPSKDSPVPSPIHSASIDLPMAPYPITPPADKPPYVASSVAANLLDPVESMPRPQDHALDNYDHEAEDQRADDARKMAQTSKDLPISLSLPPSRSAPSKPPQLPPPRRPPPQTTMSSTDSQPVDDSLAHFPPPPAPPPRRPPPAPLMLRESNLSPTIPADEEALESDSDYDLLLNVSGPKEAEKRGRRRTREEDDRVREILVQKEAEIRSLSKKSKKSSSAHSTAKETPSSAPHEDVPTSPPVNQNLNQNLITQAEQVPASLDSVLSGSTASGTDVKGKTIFLPNSLSAPILTPGLPASPRPPIGLKSPLHSPPLSPRMGTNFTGPLSPRPPRQPIPLPPNTPLQTPSPAPGEPLVLTSPKPLNVAKMANDFNTVPSSPSTKSVASSRDSPTERTHIFKGLVTEEFPDLLLPPNALPSIDVKVASSRMKPSRASLMALTQLEEDPVFTLAVFSRADGSELWRVEKDSASLSKLDQRLKQCRSFTARTPDRSLFTGHAPAKLDARRQALNAYLDELLNTPLDEVVALQLCKYLSTNTLPPYADETGSTHEEVKREGRANNMKLAASGRPFKNGYLTKRGKNFGGWKARFFLLDGPHLKYYETPGGAHLGTIKLQNAQIGKQSQQNENSSPSRGGGATTSNSSDDFDNQYRHAFLILEPKKKDPTAVTKHVLCAESDVERDQWVDALLRWIDYRDPGDEDDSSFGSKKGAAGTVSSKKKSIQSKKQLQKQQQLPQPQPPRQKQQKQSSVDSKDSLIGVSYETMQQGELPQGAPGTRQTRPTLEVEKPQTMSSQSPYSISAPRDPQVISDTTPWGSKGLLGANLMAPPTTDEKKARKRSFFGFGTKVRTSGDGAQDSLFGDNSGSGHGNGGGQTRQVFGAPLAEAVRYNGPVDVKVPLPAVVYRCIQYLDAHNAINEEGIFRLSGSNVVIKQLRERFNNESDVNLLADVNYHDIHAVASLLKMYLRELPTTILTQDLHMQFLSVTEMTNQEDKLAALNELAQRLPQANATLLKYLIAFLIKIISHADQSKMTVRNVGIVFSPTLNIPAPVFALLLQNYKAVFGIDPSEYELPSPSSDSSHGRRPSLSSQPTTTTTDAQTARPLASQTGESPHRQRLLDSVMSRDTGSSRTEAGSSSVGRNTSTPPPALINGSPAQIAQMRSASTPTPPPAYQSAPSSFPLSAPTQQQRTTTYEPHYLSQKQSSSQVSLRPAYESGIVVPPAYDPTQMPSPIPARNNPGYDRPIYDTSGTSAPPTGESAYPPKSSRRMSFGLNPQGSRSRLREESRY